MSRFVGLAWLLLIQLSLTAAVPGEFSFANVYDSNMVLQKAPQRAVLRGYSDQAFQTVRVEFDGLFYEVATNIDELGYISWSLSLEPTAAGGPYDISATLVETGTTITLTNVMFGDVFFCSGQSNMWWPIFRIDNPEEDIADSVNYPDIRFIASEQVYNQTDSSPEAILTNSWLVPDGANVEDFSAICWFFGKRLYENLNYPIGLIQSAYSGSRIAGWSSPEALSVCYPDGPPPDNDENSPSATFNAMIYPFLSYNIYGALWYQGESNTIVGAEDYSCTLSALVADWRQKWFNASGGNTDPNFTFGQVQLAGFRDPESGNTAFNWQPFRWEQTFEIGYTPNEGLPNVYTAIAIDLPDFEVDPIHPRWKRQMADRLWVGALQLAYNITTEGRYQGPFPSNFILAGNRRMEIDYDDFNVELEFRDLEATAFEMCCSEAMECDVASENWQEAPILFFGPAEVVLQSPCVTNVEAAAIRYAWAETPCPNGIENCAIYSASSLGNTLALPAPPFIFNNTAWVIR